MLIKFILLFLLSFFQTGQIMAGYTIEEVAKLTDGLGVFTVTVENTTDKHIEVSIVVAVESVHKVYSKSLCPSSNTAEIAPGNKQEIVVRKPMIGTYPDFLADGGALHLDEGKLYITYLALSAEWYAPKRGVLNNEPAMLLSGTKIIEVPDMSLTIK